MTDIQTGTQTDHDRVTSSGASIGALAVVLVMCALAGTIPHWWAFTLNWAIILGACGGITVYKRRWYGWLAFWGLAAICLTSAVMALLGAGRSLMGGLIAGAVITGIYYWLVRMPRWRPEPRDELHVFHHVFHHGLPGWAVTQGATAPATAAARKVIPGHVIRAIAAPRQAIGLLTAAREAITSRRTS